MMTPKESEREESEREESEREESEREESEREESEREETEEVLTFGLGFQIKFYSERISDIFRLDGGNSRWRRRSSIRLLWSRVG